MKISMLHFFEALRCLTFVRLWLHQYNSDQYNSDQYNSRNQYNSENLVRHCARPTRVLVGHDRTLNYSQ